MSFHNNLVVVIVLKTMKLSCDAVIMQKEVATATNDGGQNKKSGKK